jgi:hypothetical protein
MSRRLSPLAKLAVYAAVLIALFAGAYAVGSAVPDLLGDTPAPAGQLHDAPATTMVGHG